jgi:serine/threonine protein kinase
MSHPAQLAGGRYRLERVLGAGSMGVVYRAWDRGEARWRAIKLLAPIMARNTEIRARFEREAEALRRLDHPNIVAVHDFGEEREQRFLVMDLVEGGSLRDWLRRYGAMPPGLAVEAARQVGAALGAAHSAGIVHRDVKPANVLVDRGGRCKVVDFGIARLEEVGTLTRTNVKMGSLGYMAPEQQVSARDVDARADVYALGATLFSLLTDETPHQIERSLERHAGQLPDALAFVLMRATLTDPRNRYPTVGKLCAALERLAPHLPTALPGQQLFVQVHPDPLPPDEETSTIILGD